MKAGSAASACGGRRDRAFGAVVVIVAGLAQAACSQTPSSRATGVDRPLFTERDYGVSSSPRLITHDGPVRKGGGSYKLGSPYKVAGRWYVPRDEPGYDRQGMGSWYGADFHGRKTANGEIFDKNALTAAHPTLPLPSYAYVTNLNTGRTVMVRINDRGPYVGGRIIDLSHASASAIGYQAQGRAPVRVQYIGMAPLNGDDRRERRFLAEQRQGGSRFMPTASAPDRDEQPLADANDNAWSPTAYRARLPSRNAVRENDRRSGLGGPNIAADIAQP